MTILLLICNLFLAIIITIPITVIFTFLLFNLFYLIIKLTSTASVNVLNKCRTDMNDANNRRYYLSYREGVIEPFSSSLLYIMRVIKSATCIIQKGRKKYQKCDGKCDDNGINSIIPEVLNNPIDNKAHGGRIINKESTKCKQNR